MPFYPHRSFGHAPIFLGPGGLGGQLVHDPYEAASPSSAHNFDPHPRLVGAAADRPFEERLTVPTTPEEQVLIDLWRGGDQDAARQIVERYFDRLLVLARRRISQRLASRVDPEDILQSVFRTFFVRLKEGQFVFQDEDDLCKLLMRITVHKTLRQVAFHKAAKRDPNQETNQGDHHREQLLSVLDKEPSAEATIAFLDQLEHFLGQLEDQPRRIIEMRPSGVQQRRNRRGVGHLRPQDPPRRRARPRRGASRKGLDGAAG